jgi:hypothetical protein
MANKANEILIELKAENKELKAKLKDSEKNIEKLGKKIAKNTNKISSSLRDATSLIKTYFGITAIRSFVNLAGEVDSVSGSFYNLAASAKDGSDGLLEALQIASQGTVSNLDIMKTSNLALQLMGENVADQLPKMMEIAMATAKSTGQKTADMFNDIVVASGRRSVQILDNLGISSATASKYQDEFAAQLGKTREQLNETQKSQAFFYAVMKSGNELIQRVGGGALTFGQRLQVVSARFSNMGMTASRVLLPALENVLEAFTDMRTDGTSLFKGLITQISYFVNRFGYSVKLIDLWMQKISGTQGEVSEKAMKTIEFSQKSVDAALKNLRNVAAATGYTAGGYNRMAQAIKKASKNFTDIGAAMRAGFSLEQISAVTRFNRELDNSAKIYNENSGAMTSFQQKADKIHADYLKRIEEIKSGGAKGGGPRPIRPQRNEVEAEKQKKSELLNSQIQYNEYIDQFRQAELLKEQQKYDQLLKLQTGFQKNEEAMRIAYEKKKLLSENTSNKKKMESNVAYHQAKLGLLSAEWAAFKDVTNYGATLMQSNNKVLFGAGKALAYAQAMMNAAQAVTKIWAQWGWPLGGIFSGIAIAATGVQLAKIKSTKMPSYQKGRVPVFADGYIPSDHFPAFIGAKEAVITERATAANAGLLAEMNRTGKAVNPGENVVVNQNVNLSGNILSRDFVLDQVMPELETQARYAGKQLFAERGK